MIYMKKKSNIIIVSFLLLILCFTVAYTSYSLVLTKPGKAIPSGIWDIKFKEVKTSDNTNNYEISGNGQEIEITPVFNSSGYITYTITIENSGNIDGLIPNENNPIIWKTTNDSPNIEYEISQIGEVKAGESITFTINFKSNIEQDAENEINISETLTGKINFKRN